jgi:phospholipid/cholesterol/gamma-HCH transport system permease protein
VSRAPSATANGRASLAVEEREGTRTLKSRGDWIVGGLAAVDARLRDLAAAPSLPTRIDLSEVGRFDTAGAWLVHHLVQALQAKGQGVTIEGASSNQSRLLEVVAANEPEPIKAPARKRLGLVGIATRLGNLILGWLETTMEMVAFTGLILSVAFETLTGQRRFRFVAMVNGIEQAGFKAVAIIALINFLIGAVISFMSADILRQYGGQIFSVDLIAFSFLREFGVLLSAIMVAGRSGSAFTAEIGAMKGHEEIDAMRALALEPVEILVLPRVAALIVSLPLLAFIGDMMGLFGGGLVSWGVMGFSPSAFASRFASVASIDDFWVGLIKAPFFAYLIAMIGCYQGFKVTGTAESVGQRTTISVVQSIFTVIVVDALFAVFFMEIGF